jgi:hypothetical protein
MGTKEQARAALDKLITNAPDPLEIEAINPLGFEASSAIRCRMICHSCVGVHAGFNFTLHPIIPKSFEQQAQEGYQRHVEAKHE